MPESASTDITGVETGLPGFNSADPDTLRPRLHDCLAVPRWVTRVIDGRPYRSIDALLAESDSACATLDDQEIFEAIAEHPRIGQQATAPGTAARWSCSEQAAVGRSGDANIPDKLATANAEYEHRFGHIYLVCATGKSGEEILADIRTRLGNDRDTETNVVRGHLAEIAKLRLRKVVDR